MNKLNCILGFTSSLILILSFGCASNQRCPNELSEPVSVCRAEAKCGGMGTGVGMILGGVGSGISGQRNIASDDYNKCIDRDLEAQKYNSRK